MAWYLLPSVGEYAKDKQSDDNAHENDCHDGSNGQTWGQRREMVNPLNLAAFL